MLPCLPELKELRFQGGIESADGGSDADPNISHHAQLHTFVLHIPASNAMGK
ncbi:hypothetical protein CROQUDRAFT_653602 [Cronartium quercuum f. sp. fusiforme G11]|uniref:Uncharacterized protein n=1 Tax=Cronartium quercuum f. sp. fusiforme G11 TaxID=708437 RepID=A0A9P6NP62_9BASI|nr:hypothetical protein CROQUDRAFT_653602 [Cronartium quercuum f. sp. fusiforme G11]